MALISIVVSLAGLVAVNGLARSGKSGAAAVVCILLLLLGGCLALPLVYQGVLTLPMLALLNFRRDGRRLFATASVATLLIAYAIPFRTALEENHRLEALRDRYPLVSVEDRAPTPKPTAAGAASPTLKQLESEIQEMGTNDWMLRRLHQDRVLEFVNAPGFGVGRMIRPRESSLEERDPPEPIRQPARPLPSEGHNYEPFESRAAEPGLLRLHLAGVLDFANPRGFGYVKSRREVAGFRPHRFSTVPEAKTDWAINSVELLGVLVHDAPRVYLSEHLPRMDELSKTSTRTLDSFESAGLEQLTAGEDLYLRRTDNGARMLGAIRNANQCIACHGGERGDLLGAFTYHLRPTK